MAMSPDQIQKKLNQAVEGSSGDKAQIIQGIRTHFPRGTKAFRWAQDAFKGMPPKAPGGQDKPVTLLVAALKSPTDKKFQTAFQSLEAALGGKKVPARTKPPKTSPPRPPTGKAQYIKPRMPAGSSVQALSAKQRWDDAIARGADPIEATRRRIGATADKDKLAGIVVMLNAIAFQRSNMPKHVSAGKKPTPSQIKSLAEAAEKKAMRGGGPSMPSRAKPSKPAKARKVKKVKSAQRVDVAKFPLLGASWNSKVSTKSPVDNFTRAALRMRSKDKLQESIALLKTVGSGSKDKERSVFQGAIKLLKDRLKAVSPRAKVPGKKPAAVIAKPRQKSTAAIPSPRAPKGWTFVETIRYAGGAPTHIYRRGRGKSADYIEARPGGTQKDRAWRLIADFGSKGKRDWRRNKTPMAPLAAVLSDFDLPARLRPGVPKPKKAPTKKRAAVQKAAEKMALDAALRRGLKKGEKVTVQLDLVFTEV